MHLKSPEGSASFPAEVFIDRMRKTFKLEASDPLGAVHAVLLLKEGRLLVVDYDQRKKTWVGSHWQGIPVSEIVDFLSGVTDVGRDGKVSRADADGFSVVRGNRTDRYDLVWSESGQASLARCEVTLPTKHFEARFEGHAKDENDLPTFVNVTDFGQFQLELKWRNREFNQPIPIEVFQEPHSLTEP